MPYARQTGQDVLLEIIRQLDGEWINKIRLSFLFYFAHLNFSRSQKHSHLPLSDWPILKLDQGLTIGDYPSLTRPLLGDDLIKLDFGSAGGFYSVRFILTAKARSLPPFPEAAQQAVRQAIMHCKGRGVEDIADEIHKTSRSWKAEAELGEIDPFLDATEAEEYEKREKEITRCQEMLDSILTKDESVDSV